MPNEKIHRTTTAALVSPDDPTVSDGHVSYKETLTVSWYPDQNVTVLVEHEPLAGLPGEERRGAGMDLDRGEINRLIKALRRARDAAYGRDE